MVCTRSRLQHYCQFLVCSMFVFSFHRHFQVLAQNFICPLTLRKFETANQKSPSTAMFPKVKIIH